MNPKRTDISRWIEHNDPELEGDYTQVLIHEILREESQRNVVFMDRRVSIIEVREELKRLKRTPYPAFAVIIITATGSKRGKPLRVFTTTDLTWMEKF